LRHPENRRTRENRAAEELGIQQLTNYASYQGLFLAEKRGPFAEKQGSHRNYFSLFLVFFRFSGLFLVPSLCLSSTNGDPTPSKKIVPENRWKVL